MLKAHLHRFVAALALMAVPAKGEGAPVTFPPALQGIWMTADDAGRAQCERYLAARAGANSEATNNQLVGAEIVSATMLHSYAEYGEGNFYEPTQIAATSPQQWMVTANLGIDTWPGSDEDATAELAMALQGDTLRLSLITIDGEAVDTAGDESHFRCAETPADMYLR